MQSRRLSGLALGALLLAACGAPTPGTAEPAPLAGERFRAVPGGLPGRYIVVLRGGGLGAQGVEDGVRALAARYGATPRLSYPALGGFAAELGEAQARELSRDPRVAWVEQDAVIRVGPGEAPAEELGGQAVQTGPTWGLDRVDQRRRPLNGQYNALLTGRGVNAYVIDTGLRTSHAEFGGRAGVAFDSVGDGQQGQDCSGHGTHVAGTLGGARYGIAKEVRLHAVRVLDCRGDGTVSGVIAGVEWVTGHARRPAVANLSLSGGPSASLDAAVRASVQSGVTYVVAAGNERTDVGEHSPARVGEAVTVAATDRADWRANFSNFGPGVDVFAPGVDVRSASGASDTGSALRSGTSMAAPHVAGMAALYLEAHPGASPRAVQAAIVAGATGGAVTDPKGAPNRLLYDPDPARYDGIWLRDGASRAWRAGLRADLLSSTVTAQGQRGYRVETLSSFVYPGGQLRYNVLFAPGNEDRPWIGGARAADLARTRAELEARGYRLRQLGAVTLPGESGDPVRYTAVWARGEARPWVADRTYARFKAEQDRLTAQGYALASVNAYALPGEGEPVRYNAVWVRGGDRPWVLSTTREGLRQKLGELAARGYRPVDVNSFPLPGGEVRYNAVWARGADDRPVSWGWAQADFQEVERARADQGYRLLSLAGVSLR